MQEPWVTLNWIPESFQEFHQAALEGRVELNIMDQQYPWLYKNAVPFSIWGGYKKKLMKAMLADEALFRRVHDYGVDLILLKEPK